MSLLVDAMLLRGGYNTAVVCVGSATLGAAAGTIGSFVLLRRRSMASDAAGHATLPGLALAFIILALTSGDGRSLPALMAGGAVSAGLGLICIQLLTSRTRLREDAAIGAVLSVFFGAGTVLLTVIQTMQTGRQAGLSSYLLGSAAGMLRHEAELIALLAMLIAAVVTLMHRPLTTLSFDKEYARLQGLPTGLLDLLLTALLLVLVVTSLKVVGLVLSVALGITPAVSARFWTNRVHVMVPVAAAIGAVGGYIGAAISATAPQLPTGAVIVLILFVLFLLSLLLAPARGALATVFRHQAYRRRVHRRQGLLALFHGEPIYDGLTLRLMRRSGWIRRDAVPTPAGLHAARAAWHDETLWALHLSRHPEDAAALEHHRVQPISRVLPPDELVELEQALQSSVQASERAA